MNTLFNIFCGATYGGYKAIKDYNRFKAEKALEERKEETRRTKASLDNEESFKANFDPVDDYNWGMFKNED